MIKKNIVVLILFFALAACKPERGGGITNPPPSSTPTGFAKGADISWITQMEVSGKKFYNAACAEMECITSIKTLDMNTVRLRVWVNPAFQ